MLFWGRTSPPPDLPRALRANKNRVRMRFKRKVVVDDIGFTSNWSPSGDNGWARSI